MVFYLTTVINNVEYKTPADTSEYLRYLTRDIDSDNGLADTDHEAKLLAGDYD